MHVITPDRFDHIKRAHSGYASWAIWAPPTGRPKSNVGDLTILDPGHNPGLLANLRNDVVMVGLNISRTFAEPFQNFHDPGSHSNDFKLRYAFHETPFYGAYMTDVIKHIAIVDSADVGTYLKNRPALVDTHVDMLRAELRDVAEDPPTIIAFGHAAYTILAQKLLPAAYRRLIKVPHYSHYMAKENYRAIVMQTLQS